MKFYLGKFFTLVIALFITKELAAQPGCPNINAGPDVTLPCNTTCTYLVSNYFQTGATSSYVVLPLNSIMGPYQDIDPTFQGLIDWRVTGAFPCRTFNISFYQIPYYGDPNSVYTGAGCGPFFATSQIILYETTNVIEIYIANKNV